MKLRIERCRTVIVGLCMLIVWTLGGSPAIAQTTTGSIYGTVADQSGAVIQNATVTVTNTQTGETHTTKSNGSGNYVFPALVPGDYNISAQVHGFKTVTQSGIQLSSNQNISAPFTLTPGATSQNVTVTASTTLVDTRESQLAETVDQRRIEDLPLNGRNAYDLVQIVPGVTNYSAAAAVGDQNGTSFSVNGNRSNQDSFYLDGAFDTAAYRTGGNLIPNPDALQEFRLLTSNFDAEYGRSPGGVVNIISRSGTDAYHGSAYDYLRNDALNAKNYFNNEVTPLKQNQFGATFGGPVTRDRTFFFLSYEGLRIRTPDIVHSAALVTPTPAEADGDFSALNSKQWPKQPNGQPYSCNGEQGVICSALLDPVAQNILKFVPLADPVTGLTPEQSASANTNGDQGLARFDYQLTSAHKLSATYFTSHGTIVQPGTAQGNNQILDFSGGSNYENQTNVVLSDTWMISPSALNNVRVFYTLNHYIVNNLYNYSWKDFGSPVAMGASEVNQPKIAVKGYWTMGNAGNGPNNQYQEAFGVLDTFNWAIGNHTVKLGGSFLWNKYSETGGYLSSGNVQFTGSATGNALADFLLGEANSFRQNNGVYHRLYAPDPALFAQDDWRITRRLTLNLGLRWEVYAPFSGQNVFGTFEPNEQSTRFPLAPVGLLFTGDPGVPDGVVHTQWKDFAPRLGFAYDVFGSSKTSLRGGYGIFYASSQETLSGNLEQQPFLLDITVNKTPNLSTPYAPSADPFPYVLDPQNPDFISGANVVAVPADAGTPYVQEYNLTLEQQLGTQWGARVAYVGSVSRKFLLPRDENSPAYIPGAKTTTAGLNARRPYEPTPSTYEFGQITEDDPANNASYNSLQITLTRRFAHSFSLLASYVWSKSMDIDSGDPSNVNLSLVNENDLGYNRGLSDFDVPQRFVASYLWAVPNVNHWGVLGQQVLSGWQLNGITTLSLGSPFIVTSGVDTNLDGNNNDRPNQIADPHFSGHRSRTEKINEYFNTGAFSQLPANTPYGNMRRNSLIGPGEVNTDFSAFKTFPVWKENTLQFRGEIFNLFNNVNLNNPNGVMTSPKYGTIGGAGSPRIVQFALRYMF